MENHCHHESSVEESTWTSYFQDFLNEEINGEETYSCENSSQVSDAASIVGMEKILGAELGFVKKKRRRRRREVSVVINDDLEDTASSPCNSPKVCSMMDHLYQNQTGKAVPSKIEEKGNVSGQIGEKKEKLGFNGKEEEEEDLLVDLKKKGLCLVPLSMLANYLG